jgi:hypothetical protein
MGDNEQSAYDQSQPIEEDLRDATNRREEHVILQEQQRAVVKFFMMRGCELRVGTPVEGKLGDARVGSNSVALRVSKTPTRDSTFKASILKNC